MSFKRFYISPSIIIVFALPPVLLKSFMVIPPWLALALGLITVIFGIYILSSRNRKTNLWREEIILEDWKFFFRRYPWRFISEVSFVVFGMIIIATEHGLGLTAAQAFSIALALWLIPYVVGDLFFGGRRTPEEER